MSCCCGVFFIASRGSKLSAHDRFKRVCRKGEYSKYMDTVFTSSGNMPVWAEEDPACYWKAVDKYERGNGTLFCQILFAVPSLFGNDQEKMLVESFVVGLTDQERFPYTFAIYNRNDDNCDTGICVIVNERINDGVERTPETWFKRTNKKVPGKGGAIKTNIRGQYKKWRKDCWNVWEQSVIDILGEVNINSCVLEAQVFDCILGEDKRVLAGCSRCIKDESLVKKKSNNKKGWSWNKRERIECVGQSEIVKRIEETPERDRWKVLGEYTDSVINNVLRKY